MTLGASRHFSKNHKNVVKASKVEELDRLGLNRRAGPAAARKNRNKSPFLKSTVTVQAYKTDLSWTSQQTSTDLENYVGFRPMDFLGVSYTSGAWLSHDHLGVDI